MNPDFYKAVVRITNTSNLNRGNSLGSGVVVSPAGLVITNNHVIEDGNFGTAFGDISIETIQAVDRAASDARSVELVVRNESYDLAVLRIRGTPPPHFIDLLSQPPTNESLIERPVRVLGYPPLGGSTITVTRGIVSGFDEAGNIKTDAEINPGNSGGAAFDDTDAFLGIPSFIVTEEQGKLGFIISVGRIKEWIQSILKGGPPKTTAELANAFVESNLNFGGENLDQSTRYPRILGKFAAVESLLSKCEYDEVIPHIAFILEKWPRSALAYKYLGDAFLGLERYDEAAAQFRNCLAFDPGDIPAFGNLGLALVHLERHAEALQTFEQITELSDNPLELWAAYTNIARIYDVWERPDLSEVYRAKANELQAAANKRSSSYTRARDPASLVHRLGDAITKVEIMESFEKRVRTQYSELFSAVRKLGEIAESLLAIAPVDSFQQTLRYTAASLTNSNYAVALLCEKGLGADAVRVVRAMFELQIGYKYLVRFPKELPDFLDFDAVAR